MTLQVRMRPQWHKPFLTSLSEWGNIRDACGAAGISKQAAYRERDEDEQFRIAWDEAMTDAVDNLKKEAWRRALESSDRLLEFLLRHHAPEYREETQISIEQKTLNVNTQVDAQTFKEALRILVANGALDLKEILPDGYTVLPPISTNGHHQQ